MLYKYSNSSGLTKNYVKYIKQKLFLSLTKFLSFRIGKKNHSFSMDSLFTLSPSFYKLDYIFLIKGIF